MHQRLTKRIVLASFLLQALIPAGYMPGSLSEGSFVTLCPEGLSPTAMSALFGEHHHHADHKTNFVQCDLGGGLGAPAAVADVDNQIADPEREPLLPLTDSAPARSADYSAHPPRAPPASRNV